MFYHKIQSAFFTLFIIPFILPLAFNGALDSSYWQSVTVYFLYGIPVVFLYGTFTSMISDYISQKTPLRSKRVTSFFMHLVCGWLFVVPYGLLFDPSIFESGLLNFASLLGILSATVFFLVDQLLGRYLESI